MAVIHCVITKEFTFRGKPERFSNGYNFETTTALTTAYLKSVCDALVAMERVFTFGQVKFPYRVAGQLGQDALYSEEVASPPTGTGSAGTGGSHPEIAVLAQSKIGPRRYLSKYYHGAAQVFTCDDVLGNSFQNAVNTAVVKLTDGTLPGAATYCRPTGELATVPFTCDPYVRVHQLKRRGKRP